MDDPAKSLRFRWIIRDQWKLIVPAKRERGGRLELFDIVADPHEQTNMADQHPAVVTDLRRRLDEWWNPE